MTLPRRLTLLAIDGSDATRCASSRPATSSRCAASISTSRPTTLPANQEVVLEAIRGNAMEIVAEIDTGDAPMVELNVLRSPGKEEFTRIAFYRERGYRNWERYAGWDREQLRAPPTA